MFYLSKLCFIMQKPNRINKGSNVCIIAPGSAVSDPDDIRKAVEYAGTMNLNMK